jgi:phenylpropionate dioxygenase-like ring-hydroxylating dioxygenase large terminal subunit
MERTLPWSWYSDPDFARRESARIFARAWQYVGHSGQIAEPGSSFASWAGEIPVVVTHPRDGELRAFQWKRPAAVDTWGPFVFVNPDADAEPLATALGEVPVLLAELLDLDALEHRFRLEWEVEANWKVACENFLECYHCAVAHPTFSAVVDVAPDAYRLRTSGLTSSQFGPLRENGGSPFSGGEIRRSQFHFVWPNTGINIFPGRPNLSCGPMAPRGAERTWRFLDYFFAPDVDQEWIDELLELDNQVGREDTRLVEGVQRGIRSGVLEAGRLMSASEPLIAHFQQLTADAVLAASAS